MLKLLLPILLLLGIGAVLVLVVQQNMSLNTDASTRGNKATSILIGTNYTHMESSLANCSLDNSGVIVNYHLPGVRDRVKEQMQRMKFNGVDSMRTIIWNMTDASKHTWGIVSSKGGVMQEPYKSNLMNFVSDIKATGFKRLTVSYGPEWTNKPNNDNYDPNTFDENWKFVQSTREIVKKYGPADTRIDLFNEAAPSQYLAQKIITQRNEYNTKLYKAYVQKYGNSDVTLSVIADHKDPSRMDYLISSLKNSKEAMPPWFEIHIYPQGDPSAYQQDTLETLKMVDKKLTENRLNQPLVIGETYYNNNQVANGILQFALSSNRKIEEVMEWPIQSKENCQNITIPHEVTNYVNVLRAQPTQTKLTCEQQIAATTTNPGTATITASWKSITVANRKSRVQACLWADETKSPKMFTQRNEATGSFTEKAPWIGLGREYVFNLYDTGGNWDSTCQGTLLAQCKFTGK